MDKKKYVKPEIAVIEVESNGIMLTMSVGDKTDTALIKRRENMFSDDEESNMLGGMDVFNSEQSQELSSNPQ